MTISGKIASAVLPALMLMLPVGRSQQAVFAPPDVCLSKVRGVRFPSRDAYPAVAAPFRKARHALIATRMDRLYRTTVRRALADKPDFAGYYAVAYWGCGTGCVGFVVVDQKTGRVYDPPYFDVGYHYGATESDQPDWSCFEWELDYTLTSRLLVVEGCPASKPCGRRFYLMGPKGLREIGFDPDLNQNGSRVSF